jgi:hypothetical protein
MKYLLSETPTTEHRVEIGTDGIKLTQQTKLQLTNDETSTLEWFLQAVKSDPSIRHSYTDANFYLDFDPSGADQSAFYITHRVTGGHIIMRLSTAYKLLDALTGKAEQLTEEEE